MASTSADVKPSAMDIVFEILQGSSDPLGQEQLEALTQLPAKDLSLAINTLLKTGRISVMATATGQIAFQIAEESVVLKQEKCVSPTHFIGGTKLFLEKSVLHAEPVIG